MAIDYVDDWFARLKTRLYTQFRDASTWHAMASIIARQVQDIENAAQSLLTVPSIADSEGVNQDVLGRIIGQNRSGLTDAEYQPRLYARVLASKSDGSGEDLYDTVNALLQYQNHLRIRNSPIRAFSLTAYGPITPQRADATVQFIGEAKEAGAGSAIFEWQETNDSDMFTFMVGSTMTAATSIGATTLTVKDTSGFAPGGSLRIDAGLPSEEILAAGLYTVTSATTLSTTALTVAHSIGSAVEWLEAPGKGFGRASSDSVGGTFAHAEAA